MSGGEGVRNPADVMPLIALLNEVIEYLETANAILTALPTLEETGQVVTTDGTEQNVYVNEIPAGVFRPMCVKLDCTNQTAAETIVLRTYYRIAPAGAYVLQDTLTFVGAISPELLNIDLEPNRYGIRVTLELTAGTNRDYTWEVFYKI